MNESGTAFRSPFAFPPLFPAVRVFCSIAGAGGRAGGLSGRAGSDVYHIGDPGDGGVVFHSNGSGSVDHGAGNTDDRGGDAGEEVRNGAASRQLAEKETAAAAGKTTPRFPGEIDDGLRQRPLERQL